MKSARNSSRNEFVCKLYESGKSIRYIAKIVGLSYSAVRYIVRKNNIIMRPAHRTVGDSKVDLEQLRILVSEHKSKKEIAEHFGCSISCVGYHMHRNNLCLRNVSPDDVKLMLKFRESGLTNEQIAKRMGRATQTIQNHIGVQPAELTQSSIRYRSEMRHLKAVRRNANKALMQQKRIDEARIEAERKAAEEAARREEEARAAVETNIREILIACGLPSELHIESSVQGNAILANMQNRFSAAIAAA